MRLTLSEVARATGGTVSGPDVEVRGAATDSRAVAAGQLFVPVVAARDGHDFIADALAAGAAAYLTARPPAGGSAVRVADTSAALMALGAHARDRLPDRVVGITGSVGKTTVKDLTAGALAAAMPTHASAASFNNEIGVPLTLLGAPDGVAAVVVEMGARRPGDIARLRAVVRPTVAVITSIGDSHLEFLGDRQGVAREKGSLLEELPGGGTAVVNDVDCGPEVRRRSPAPVLTFGTGRGDVRAELVALDDELRPTVRLHTPWGEAEAVLSVRGGHQALNAAAAVAAAVSAGAGLEEAVAGMASATGSHWRMELARTPAGATVLNDAYNANPVSMAAALRSLAAVPGERHLAVLGPMEELGPGGAAAHAAMAGLAAGLGIEVWAVGTDRYGSPPLGSAELRRRLAATGAGDVILIKASRAAGLETVVSGLTRGTP